MRKECPLCEKPASKDFRLQSGTSWRDSFGKPPHSLFSKYMMVHAAPTANGIHIFLHTETDMQQGGAP